MPVPRPIVVVTGANSGIGFGVCHRLLVQLSQSSPPDARPQFVSIHGAPKDQSIRVEPCNGLTLILACRSKPRAMEARQRLLDLLDEHIQQERAKPGYDGHAEVFRENLSIDFHPIDMSDVPSVFRFGDELSEKYPYISHLICNAGCGSFDGINWPVAIKQVFTHPFVGVTVTDYKRQTSGRMSDNGLGFVWQCNVFAHYVLYRHIQSLFASYARVSSQPARVLWTSSLESSPEWYSRDDWQLINSDRSYEGSKYEIDLIGHRLARQALQQKGGAPIVRHFTVHPGIAESNMARNLVGGFLDAIKLLVFYFIRLCGSPNHPITAYKAAVSAVHLSLVSLAFIPSTLSTFNHVKVTSLPTTTVLDDSLDTNSLYKNGVESVKRAQTAEEEGILPPLKFGAQADWRGRERVGVMTVLEWEEHEKEADFLVEKCESLYQSFFKLEVGASKANGNTEG